ncbi:hypothetical protein IMG5_155280 [Ichthyophthirius multifiliis]|uniref:Uncharacterized protein n=1 Tax=Ichthyophthirius multifiliis TaxID=5932 RepID=G0QZ94_ICHMU|nr:hypothetical protein IMG5_155280 [Ichthyophthirius multifiliis]EGR29451.1 hypothetical protein IMG5_155280 [Ichthyophthirius multifiliis]|eukprot:XP_004030687.1 hypothetical protein IMG5_155280 [Ichthyophthirius multifiliis]
MSIPNGKNILPIPEVNIVFNLSNDPAYKYSIINFCDKSSEPKEWVSHHLKKHVLYIETDNQRFEVSMNDEEDMILVNEFDQYKLVKVKDPFLYDNEFMKNNNIPLNDKNVEVIYKDLDWSEFKWGTQYLKVRDFEINCLKSYKFYQKTEL